MTADGVALVLPCLIQKLSDQFAQRSSKTLYVELMQLYSAFVLLFDACPGPCSIFVFPLFPSGANPNARAILNQNMLEKALGIQCE